MRLVSWSGAAGSAVRWRSLLREVAASLPPSAPGLLARHWRLDRGAIIGRYLFDDGVSPDACERAAASDPALARIRAQAPLGPPAVTRTEDDPQLFDRPLVIVAAPRSGSTLLYELLARGPQWWSVDGESEGAIEGIPALHGAARGFDSHRLTDADAQPATLATLRAGFMAQLRDRRGRRYLDLPERERPARLRMLEKTTENSLRVPFMAAAFPDARLVFLHRDGRQSVSSILEAWGHDGFVKIPSLPGWRRRRWHFGLSEGWRDFNDAPLVDVAAFQWGAANRTALDDLEALARNRWMTVDFAELTASPAAVVRRICEFAEVEVDAELARALAGPLPVASTAITPPSPIKWRSNPDFREASVRRYRAVSARLRGLGSESAPPPPRRASAAPVRFHCFVDEVAPGPELDPAACIVAPSLRLQLGATVPLELVRRTRSRDRFLPDHPLLWVEDLRTRVVYPLWLQRRDAFRYRALVAGARPPSTLTDDEARRLATAGVLARPDELRRLRAAGEDSVTGCAAQFARDGYCVLRSLVSTPHVAALSRYYRALIAYGEWMPGDEQVRRRYGYHNESVARYFHHQLRDVVSRVVGESVKPTYAYVSAYREGATLKPHVDREQCVFTLSLWLDEGTNADAEPWPLWFQLDRGRVSVTQTCGDAVLFRGSDIPHWRDAPPRGRASTTLLFHYVPQSFRWSLD